jgi:hypothetical protein
MGAAISLLLILTLSVFITRIASVALRLTGLPNHVARFQARSAFTGAGFTTAESEAVVNHPIRRRLIGLLMLVGNLGLVTILATLIVSLTSTEGTMTAISGQLLWLLGAVALLWLVVLNPVADRIMCKSIGWLLQRTTSLGQSGPTKLLQMANGYSVAEHMVPLTSDLDGAALSELCRAPAKFMILGIERNDGSYVSSPELLTRLVAADRLVVYGSDDQHATFHEDISAWTSGAESKSAE